MERTAILSTLSQRGIFSEAQAESFILCNNTGLSIKGLIPQCLAPSWVYIRNGTLRETSSPDSTDQCWAKSGSGFPICHAPRHLLTSEPPCIRSASILLLGDSVPLPRSRLSALFQVHMNGVLYRTKSPATHGMGSTLWTIILARSVCFSLI